MILYSHAILARQFQPVVKPDNPTDYLWGAVVPDIRYLARLPRMATHRPDKDIIPWFSRHPGYESFIQGYRVHTFLDKIDTAQLVGGAFPLNFVRWLRRQECPVRKFGDPELFHLNKRSGG